MTAFDIWLLAISPFVGSFLGVLVDRLPEGRDVIRARSACGDCGHRLGPADLIPLLSFASSRGRCRYCNARIPWHLPLVETLAIGAAALAVGLGDPAEPDIQTGLRAVWLWCLLALGLTDWRTFRLPLPLTLTLLATGLMLGAGFGGGPWAAVLGASVGYLALAALRLAYRLLRGRDGMGLGDAILLAGIGAALPLAALPVVTLIAALLALGVAALRGATAGHTALPLGTYLCISGAIGAAWLNL